MGTTDVIFVSGGGVQQTLFYCIRKSYKNNLRLFIALGLNSLWVTFSGNKKVIAILGVPLSDRIGHGKWMVPCLTYFPSPVKWNIGIFTTPSMKTCLKMQLEMWRFKAKLMMMLMII